MAHRVLLIDDDVRLAELLVTFFSANDVLLTHAPDGTAGLRTLGASAFDAVFLDIMMPGLDGLSVLRKIREKSAIPVLMLTAKGDETDRVVGLELGADDYLAKPFSPRELLARLRAVLRRGHTGPLGKTFRASGIELDAGSRTVTLDGRDVDLTGLEFDLLHALLSRPGRVVQRGALLELAGRDDVTVSERTIDVHISHLRKKLGDVEKPPKLIQTVRGIGYVIGRSSE